MILANDFSSGLIRFQKLLAQMANRVLLDLARAESRHPVRDWSKECAVVVLHANVRSLWPKEIYYIEHLLWNADAKTSSKSFHLLQILHCQNRTDPHSQLHGFLIHSQCLLLVVLKQLPGYAAFLVFRLHWFVWTMNAVGCRVENTGVGDVSFPLFFAFFSVWSFF